MEMNLISNMIHETWTIWLLMDGLKTNIKAELMLQNVQILKTLFIFSFYIWSTLISYTVIAVTLFIPHQSV